jgi:histidyl-tRNA synthetase
MRVFLAAADQHGRALSFKLALELRRHGVATETDYDGRSLKSQMRRAAHEEYGFAMVLGGNEVNSGTGNIKRLRDGVQAQTPCSAEGIIATILDERQWSTVTSDNS